MLMRGKNVPMDVFFLTEKAWFDTKSLLMKENNVNWLNSLINHFLNEYWGKLPQSEQFLNRGI